MEKESEPAILKSFMDAVRGLVESVKEMLAASKLLRTRIESHDAFTSALSRRLDRIVDEQRALDQRLTQMENNLDGRFRHVWNRIGEYDEKWENLHNRVTVLEGTVNVTRPS